MLIHYIAPSFEKNTSRIMNLYMGLTNQVADDFELDIDDDCMLMY